MVARATVWSSPLACAPRAPSRHRTKDHTDVAVARWDALPWSVAHPGVGSPIVDSPIGCSGAAAAPRAPAVHALEI